MSAPETLPIATPRDLVTFTIKINGQAIGETYEVVSITVAHELNRIPFAKLTLHDGSVPEADFRISNEDTFIPGKEIEIFAGYRMKENKIFKGKITKHGLKVRRNGSSFLNLECKDVAVKLTIGQKSNYFIDKTDKKIIEDILDGYGFSYQVQTLEVEHKQVVQFKATDWDFIMTRVEMNGMVSWLDDGKLIVKKPALDDDTQLNLLYGATILEFDSEMDARDQVQEIKAWAWDYTNQDRLEATATEPELPEQGNLAASDLAAVVNLQEYILAHSGSFVAEELQGWADAKLLKNRLAKIRGRVRCEGYAQIKPLQCISLNGLGNRMNGKVLVSGVRHELNGGSWETDIQFGLAPEWFTATNQVNSLPAAGMLPAVQGLQIGIVTQLQEDPAGEDRIKIKLPVVGSEDPGVWARVACLDAGEERGTFFRPEIDDEVIVGFIDNDSRHPVVLGALNSSAKPAPLSSSNDNHEKGYVSRSKMKFIFNDDKISVTLETPAGKRITLDEDQDTIFLEDEHKNTITMNAEGITIKTDGNLKLNAKKDVSVEGMNVKIKAQTNFKAEGSAGAEMSTSAVAVLKGSLVQIN